MNPADRSRAQLQGQPVSVPHNTYQIDFVAVNCGKIVSASKRRIRFKFGCTNLDALHSGKRGTECRGSEHEVVVNWSLSSGKQAIVYDGREVFFDVNENLTHNKLRHKWRDEKTNRDIEVVAHAAPVSSKGKADPDWRQYNILVNGLSYFNMPKIFQLGVQSTNAPTPDARLQSLRDRVEPPKRGQGTRGAGTTAVVSGRRTSQGPGYDGSGGRSANNSRGGSTSFEQSAPAPAPAAVEVFDLLSFDGDPAPTPPPQQQHAYPPQHQGFDGALVVAQTQQANQYSYDGFNVPAPSSASYQQAPGALSPTSSYNAFAPTAAAATPITPTAPAPAYQYEQPPQSYAAPVAPSHVVTPSPSMNNSAATFAPGYFSQGQSQQQQHTQPGGLDGAVQSLVNIDDLLNPAAAAPITREDVARKVNAVDAQKPLGELKAGGQSSIVAAKKPVMNSFQQQQQPGYGYGYPPQQQQQQPPPPMQGMMQMQGQQPPGSFQQPAAGGYQYPPQQQYQQYTY